MPQVANSACNIIASQVTVAATSTATLTCPANQTVWLSGIAINGGGATAGSSVTATITGLTGGTVSISVLVPTGAGVQLQPIVLEFNPPLQGVPGTNVVLSCPSFGAGSTGQSVLAWGFASQA